MKIKKYIIGFLVGAFGMLNVNAAKLEFDGDRSISYNGTGTVDIKLNSEGEEVKKIEFVLSYDTNFINVSLTDNVYGLVRKPEGKKITITSLSAIKDGVISTINVKNVRPEQANTALSIKEIKFDDKTGTDVTRDFVLKYTTTTTTRAKNTSSKLSAITFKYGDIVDMTPTFKSNVFEYKIKNDNDKIRKLTFQRFACEEEGCNTEVSCTTNGCTVDGNSVYLVVGKNEVVVKNISEDGKNTTEYKFLVYRGPTTDGSPYLKSLAIEGFAINEKFDKNTLEYTTTITDITELTVNAVASNSGSKIMISDNYKNLVKGDNDIKIAVTAEDGVTTKTYVIKVTLKMTPTEEELVKANTKLKSLKVDKFKIDFNADTKKYTLSVPYKTKKLNILAEAENPNATINMEGNTTLKVGRNVINIVVTSEDTENKDTYVLSVTREKEEQKVVQTCPDETSTREWIMFTVSMLLTFTLGIVLGYFLCKKEVLKKIFHKKNKEEKPEEIDTLSNTIEIESIKKGKVKEKKDK